MDSSGHVFLRTTTFRERALSEKRSGRPLDEIPGTRARWLPGHPRHVRMAPNWAHVTHAGSHVSTVDQSESWQEERFILNSRSTETSPCHHSKRLTTTGPCPRQEEKTIKSLPQQCRLLLSRYPHHRVTPNGRLLTGTFNTFCRNVLVTNDSREVLV